MSKQKVSPAKVAEKNAKRAAHFQAFWKPGQAEKLHFVHAAKK